MSYIQQTKEYLEFLESDEYNAYLQEIQFHREKTEENKSSKIYNKFIKISNIYEIIYS
jgi:hypothetical protein